GRAGHITEGRRAFRHARQDRGTLPPGGGSGLAHLHGSLTGRLPGPWSAAGGALAAPAFGRQDRLIKFRVPDYFPVPKGKSNMPITRFFAAVLLVLAVLAPRLSHAHPTGVSKMDFFLKQDTLEAVVDVNSADLLYALETSAIEYLPKSEYGPLSARIAHYFQTRIDLKFDGRGPDMKVLQWRREGGGPANRLDSADLAD